MLCQKCQQKEATVHLTVCGDGPMRKENLCEQCAEARGIPVAEYAARYKAWRCYFCRAQADVGDSDELAYSTGENRTTNMCMSCAREFNRYMREALAVRRKDLSDEQRPFVTLQLLQDAKAHMKEWLSRQQQ